MPHKTFEDETFPIKTAELELNSLTESDPYVDHVRIVPDSENVETIKYSAMKEVQKQGTKKDPVSGVEFEATTSEKQDQRLSEVPEKLKQIRALAGEDGRDVKLNTNIGRYTDENGENASFYITDSMLEDAEVATEDEADEGEQGNEDEEVITSSESEDQDAESQDGSADSNEETEDSEDSTTESSEDDEETVF